MLRAYCDSQHETWPAFIEIERFKHFSSSSRQCHTLTPICESIEPPTQPSLDSASFSVRLRPTQRHHHHSTATIPSPLFPRFPPFTISSIPLLLPCGFRLPLTPALNHQRPTIASLSSTSLPAQYHRHITRAQFLHSPLVVFFSHAIHHLPSSLDSASLLVRLRPTQRTTSASDHPNAQLPSCFFSLIHFFLFSFLTFFYFEIFVFCFFFSFFILLFLFN